MTARGLLWVGMLVAAFPAALLPMAKVGGAVNGVLPVVVLAGPVTLILVAEVVAARAAGPVASAAARAWWPGVAMLSAGAVFVLLNPVDRDQFAPDRADWQRAEELNDYIAGLDGGVLLPSQPFLAPRDGHEHAAGPHHGATSTRPTCRGTTWRPRSAWMASAPASERELGSVPGWQLAVVRRAGAAALDRARLADRPPRARARPARRRGRLARHRPAAGAAGRSPRAMPSGPTRRARSGAPHDRPSEGHLAAARCRRARGPALERAS